MEPTLKEPPPASAVAWLMISLRPLLHCGQAPLMSASRSRRSTRANAALSTSPPRSTGAAPLTARSPFVRQGHGIQCVSRAVGSTQHGSIAGAECIALTGAQRVSYISAVGSTHHGSQCSAFKARHSRWPRDVSACKRTHVYTYAAKVWDLSIVQGPFSVAPCETLALRFATFASLYAVGMYGEAGLT
jgi:hypothetical protein